MKNVQMFTALNTGIKIPFAFDKFTTVLPLTGNSDGGSTLYGVGIPSGIQILEPCHQVTELYSAWLANNAVGVAGQV